MEQKVKEEAYPLSGWLRRTLIEKEEMAAAETRCARLRGARWLLVSVLSILIPCLIEVVCKELWNMYLHEHIAFWNDWLPLLIVIAGSLTFVYGMYKLLTAGAQKKAIEKLLKM